MIGSQRQYLKYTFFKALPEWERLDKDVKSRGSSGFLNVLNAFSKLMTLKTYSIAGIRGDVDFLIWAITYRPEDPQGFVSKRLSTRLGKFLRFPTISCMKKVIRIPCRSGGARLERRPSDTKHLLVYPFAKKGSGASCRLGKGSP